MSKGIETQEQVLAVCPTIHKDETRTERIQAGVSENHKELA